jgi:hypothetical protein
MSNLIRCGNYKMVLKEDPNTQPNLCPPCASIARMFDCTITEKVVIAVKIGMKAKRQSKGMYYE